MHTFASIYFTANTSESAELLLLCIFIQLEFGQQWARCWYEYDKQY